MKKIIIAVAALLSMQAIYAQQVKTISEAKASLETAKAALENPKKAAKYDTWMKLGLAYVEAYMAPQGNSIPGTPLQESDIMMAKTKLRSTSQVTLDGKSYTKKSYATVNYYFNANNLLEIVEVTKPIDSKALAKAIDAYSKAAELDVKGKKTKDIKAALAGIQKKYGDDAVSFYQLGKLPESSRAFENAAKAAATAPLSSVDTLSIYNAGFTALKAGDNARAKKFFSKAVASGYKGENGEVYAKLADIVAADGDKGAQKKYLEQGFEKFPESEVIIIGLINYYINSEDNTDELFALMEKAKAKDPKNASLYSVEGNIREKLGQNEEAIACWRKCVEVNPDFADGYFSEGYHYMKQADELASKASEEKDWKKYDEMMVQYDELLRKAVPLVEAAYEREKDAARKNAFAGLVKNASFRLRQDPKYKEIYEKYNSIYQQ